MLRFHTFVGEKIEVRSQMSETGSKKQERNVQKPLNDFEAKLMELKKKFKE